jgi:hypothetical protein
MPFHWEPVSCKESKEDPLKKIRQIPALEVLCCISEGLTRKEMMTKLRVSGPAFELIVDQLHSERHRRAVNILADFKSGMTPQEIARRNHFKVENFDKIIKNLERLGLSSPIEPGADIRRPLVRHEFEERRRSFRVQHPVLVTKIYEVGGKELPGLILDLSERGVRTRGLQVDAHRKKSLFFMISDFGDTEPISFECRCRWTSSHDISEGSVVAGFEIISMPKKNFGILKTVIATERALEVAS